MEREDGQVSISTLDEPDLELDRMAQDVREGLAATPKDLSSWPKYFYDAEGSRLFEKITELPEYYQTRTESSIHRTHAGDILERSGCRELVELGSGAASSKTRILIEALLATDRHPARYVPFDVSESALKESGDKLRTEYPDLQIQGYVGDFDKSLGALLGDGQDSERGSESARGERLVVFLGGTIGNFYSAKRQEFLSEISAGLRSGDHVLIGMDLVKDPSVLAAAYDDSAGVTARFNKNMLNVMNDRLGADFDPDLFDHRAVYDANAQRVEMWMDATEAHEVRILGDTVNFRAGEGMRTEISTKFTPNSAQRVFEDSSLKLLDLYTDDENLFGLAFGTLGEVTSSR